MRRLFREPLTLFLLLGACFFTLFAFLGPDEGQEDAFVVDDGYIMHIAASWTQQMGRPPSREELQMLLDHAVEQDLLYKEALSRGMERNDEIVKRRLAQKMRFFLADMEDLSEPTESDLVDCYEQNISDYRSETRYSFEHIYFSPDARQYPEQDAQEVLKETAGRPSIDDGDRIELPNRFSQLSKDEIMAKLGERFCRQLMDLPIGEWTGPIRSGFGYHLVRIDAIQPSLPLPLEECRDRVSQDLRRQQEEEAYSKLIDQLKERYPVEYRLKEFKMIVAER